MDLDDFYDENTNQTIKSFYLDGNSNLIINDVLLNYRKTIKS